MKKLLLALVLSTASTASSAHGYNSYYGYDWVAPLVIGGIGGYMIGQNRNPPPPQTIIIQQPPQVISPAPVGYYWDNLVDARCNCYRLVLVPRP